MNVPVPQDISDLQIPDSTLTALQPTEFRADLVLLLPEWVIVVEVQRARKQQKPSAKQHEPSL